MRDLPAEERPREKLLKNQSDSLSIIELIAIVLGSGTKEKPVLQLAQEIVAHFGSLENLSRATIQELCQIKGVGPAKAIQLMAAFHLGVRLSRELVPDRVKIEHPIHAYRLIKDKIAHESREHLIVILLDVKGYVISDQLISVGTLTESLVHPREVFYPAIRHKAASIILAHNHPSGDPTPSPQDISLTKQLMKAGELMGIKVQDHIIVGKGRYISLNQAQKGIFPISNQKTHRIFDKKNSYD